MNARAAKYATTSEAADALGVSRRSLARWAQDGVVRPAMTTPGGHFRWDVDQLRTQLQTAPEALVTDSPSTPEKQPVAAAIITSPLGALIGARVDGKPPWTFIAGEIEPGESPEDAAVREVKEETGLVVTVDTVIGRRVHPKTGRTMIYVAASSPSGSTEVFNGDPAELSEVRWATLSQLDDLMGGMVYEPVHKYLTGTIPS